MASHSYRTNVSSSSNLTNYSFTTVDIGTAAAGRRVAVGIGSVGSDGLARAVSSVTIGGVAATRDVHENNTDQFTSEIWSALVPTGTTATIVVNHDGVMISCSIGVWAVYDVEDTPSDTGSGVGSSLTIDIAANGILIGNSHTDGAAVTWVGATENFDDATLGDAAGSGHSGASRQATSAETGTTVSTSGAANYIVAASWAPVPPSPVYKTNPYQHLLVR